MLSGRREYSAGRVSIEPHSASLPASLERGGGHLGPEPFSLDAPQRAEVEVKATVSENTAEGRALGVKNGLTRRNARAAIETRP